MHRIACLNRWEKLRRIQSVAAFEVVGPRIAIGATTFTDHNQIHRRKLHVNQLLDQTSYDQAWTSARGKPEEYWAEAASRLTWTKPWDKVLDNSNPPFTQWFPGGELSVCYNAVDRHVEGGHGNEVAIIHDSPVTQTVRNITYAQLLDEVSRLAGVLSSCGVAKGDRVLIYMPMIPEAVVAMLAAVRLGAFHSLVFGGFAARELAVRINHCRPKVIVSSNGGIERNKVIPYKPILEKALSISEAKPKRCIIFQRPGQEPAVLQPGLDLSWDDAMSVAKPHDCVPVSAMDPLYVLYTSGTTGDPKGVLRPSGSHAVVLNWSMDKVYGVTSGQTWWAASDLGWVVGHSYICYAPLLARVKAVLYEGKPVGTPDSSAFFRVLDEHDVVSFFVAPTALRAIRQDDPHNKLGSKYKLDKLRYLFVAGEHCDMETLDWAKKHFKVPVLDNWWQTESGSPITASCVGLDMSLDPPRDVCGKPVPGWDIHVLQPDGTKSQPGELGRIVAKLPLPPGFMSTLYKNDARYKEVYFKDYPGYYDTMDAGMKTKDGYVCVMSRDDDVINVAGHRLSTGALEEAMLLHDALAECAVVGVPDTLKGEVPLGLYVIKKGVAKSLDLISKEVIQNVRDVIGPVAAFKLTAQVQGLPKTRSGKIARKTIRDLARNKQVKIPVTIDDPRVYKDIKRALQTLGYAASAPDPH